MENEDNGEAVEVNLDSLSRNWSHVRSTFPAPDFLSAVESSLIESGLQPEATGSYLNGLRDPAKLFLGKEAAGILLLFEIHFGEEEEEETETVENFSGGQIPAAEESIKGLDEFKIPEECAICWEKLPPGVTVRRMPCSHIFHSDCIVTWLRKNHTCPLCRFQIPTSNAPRMNMT